MDQAGAYPSPGQPERRHGRPADGRNRLEHPVVVGFDGSPSSRNALAYAGGVAHRLGRSLLVVHVSSPGMFSEPLTGQVIGLPEHTSELESWLLTELDRSTDRSGLDVHVLTRRGSPARELAAAAAEQDADALIIGAPARAWHRLGGSVPGWLARHARCPVIVVPRSCSGGLPWPRISGNRGWAGPQRSGADGAGWRPGWWPPRCARPGRQ